MGPGSLDECLGCIYEESDDINVHLECCSICKRAFYTEEDRNLHEDKYTPLSYTLRFRINEPIYNCNRCEWINITVEQRKKLYFERRRNINHICNYYDKVIFHRENDKNGAAYLHPCAQCIKNNFEKFKTR